MYFKERRFYPQNFIIIDPDEQSACNTGKKIADEAKSISPDMFTSKDSIFCFQLRYCLPYESRSFNELKRLQYNARLNTRFKDEYYGYILLDISEWAGHIEEYLFSEVALSFLSSMQRFWKYIFFSSVPLTENEYKTINEYFWCYPIHSEKSNSFDYDDFICTLKRTYGITIDSHSSKKLNSILSKQLDCTTVPTEALQKDMSLFFGTSCHIGETGFNQYIDNKATYLYYLLTDEYKKALEKKGKENGHGI